MEVCHNYILYNTYCVWCSNFWSFNQVLESVVKNCGQTVHDEVASKQTMEELKDLFKVIYVI